MESIISEKLHALISKGDLNSRSKDIFDLSFLLDRCEGGRLLGAIKATFQAARTELPQDILRAVEEIDDSILRLGWISATSSIGPLDFDSVKREMLEKLRVALEIG